MKMFWTDGGQHFLFCDKFLRRKFRRPVEEMIKCPHTAFLVPAFFICSVAKILKKRAWERTSVVETVSRVQIKLKVVYMRSDSTLLHRHANWPLQLSSVKVKVRWEKHEFKLINPQYFWSADHPRQPSCPEWRMLPLIAPLLQDCRTKGGGGAGGGGGSTLHLLHSQGSFTQQKD